MRRSVVHQAKRLLRTGAAALLLAGVCPSVLAQCAMCRAAAENSTDAASLAGSMNLAVLVLLVPPVVMFCIFMVVLYRWRKAPAEMAANELAEAGASRRNYPRAGDDGERRRRSGGDNDKTGTLAEASASRA